MSDSGPCLSPSSDSRMGDSNDATYVYQLVKFKILIITIIENCQVGLSGRKYLLNRPIDDHKSQISQGRQKQSRSKQV